MNNGPSSIFRAPNLLNAADAKLSPGLKSGGAISLRLMHMERLKGDVMWLRYEVKE
jgi:hypothetical protein